MTPEQKQQFANMLNGALQAANEAENKGNILKEPATQMLNATANDDAVPPSVIEALQTLEAQGHAIIVSSNNETGAAGTIGQLIQMLNQQP